jgi:hypothetical protein
VLFPPKAAARACTRPRRPSGRCGAGRRRGPRELLFKPLPGLDEGPRNDLEARLAAVERAEPRLRAGTYGLSVKSGEPIPAERLEALPTAELTVEEEHVRGTG